MPRYNPTDPRKVTVELTPYEFVVLQSYAKTIDERATIQKALAFLLQQHTESIIKTSLSDRPNDEAVFLAMRANELKNLMVEAESKRKQYVAATRAYDENPRSDDLMKEREAARREFNKAKQSVSYLSGLIGR